VTNRPRNAVDPAHVTTTAPPCVTC